MRKIISIFLSFYMMFSFLSVNIHAEDKIDLYSEYAIVLNLNDNRIMYDKNSNEKMYPASMTKMMSVLVALENIDDLQKTYTFKAEVLEGLWEAQASVAGFSVGDCVTYEDLLYGIMLPSGADASRAIAFSLFGSEEGFVDKMNEKAKELKMNNTHFVNTSGLHDDNHYTTVSDLAKLLKYALKNKEFKKIFTTHKYVTSDQSLTFTSTFSKQKQYVSIDTSMIQGTKTGFTYPASLCLASYAKVDEEEYIAITGQTHSGNSYPYHIVDAANIYHYFYGNYHRIIYLKENDVVITLPIEHGWDDTYQIVSKEDISILCKGKKNVELVFEGLDKITTPLEEDSYLGEMKLIEDGKEIYSQKFYLDEKISKNYFSYYFAHPFIFLRDFLPLFVLLFLLNRYINYKNVKKRKIYRAKKKV